MALHDREQQARGRSYRWWYSCAIGLLFACLLAAGWAFAPGVSAGAQNLSYSSATGSPPGEAPAAPDCSPDWNVVASPNGVLHDTVIYAVDAIAPNDAWAGGYFESNTTPAQNVPYFEHWNGASWSPVSAPLPAGGISGEIHSISAHTSSDVWAVGLYSDGTNTHVLIERWGGIQWNVVTGSNPSATDNELFGVSAVSTNNVWAAGYYVSGGLQKTLVEQWNGSLWVTVASPNQGTGGSSLQDISVVPGSAGSDVWAVGSYAPTPVSQGQNLTLHYNGSNWVYVASPNQGSGSNILTGVSAVSANDVWAAGGYATGTGTRTLAEHWNGSSWSIAPTVDPDPHQNLFQRVFARASNDVWAAGWTRNGATVPTLLIEHWNGSAWAVSSNTAVGGASTGYSIGGTSGSDVWMVGFYMTTTSTPAESLAMHFNGSNWSVVTSADAPSGVNVLNSVDADSVNDIWTVGATQGVVSGTPVSRALIEHWNGSNWGVVPSADPGVNLYRLYGVDVISPNDVWAVGSYLNSSGKFQTLIEHWGGTIWSIIPSPNPGGANYNNELVSVSAESASDVWAVGDYDSSTTTNTLILHWNGSSWTHFASPSPGAYGNYLASVSVVPGSGGSDVWAAGYYNNAQFAHFSTLFERWNGTHWSVVPSPNVSGASNQILDLFALSASDAWAAGSANASPILQNLVLHWNGTAWTQSPVQQNGNQTYAAGVTGTAANDVYVAGAFVNSGNQSQAFVEHWNGSAWSTLPSVAAPGRASQFSDMVMLSSTNMWVVGFYEPAGFSGRETLTEHYNPCPTSCTITFSDVPQGSTFYPYIHCLACLGIINGYPDGTFKPNANVTRGQLSKIVANSAGFHDAQTTRMFQDVPVGSTFQVYIGRLASRGYINGYPCGGTNEPCVPPGNLPYFRPNANATRGQISKIVSNAAGFSDTPSGQQFQDVPVASTYYAYIYRLVSRNVMAGYPCGGAGEPCVPPGNLPYFRPNNNATRGQTSKIVGNTFNPDCSFLGAGKR